MNILLMGCSWAVPNYFGPPGDPIESHMEFLLRRQEHVVFNCARNGASNLHSLDRAKELIFERNFIDHAGLPTHFIKIDGDIKFDLVIWFHTDPGRELKFDKDIIDNTNKSSREQLDELCAITYKEYNKFFEELNAKVIIIGGCSDLNPIIHDYIKTNFIIESWQQILIGKGSETFTIVSGSNPPADEDIEIVNETLEVAKLMNDRRDLFPDGGHPGRQAHLDLFNFIDKNFIKLTM